MDFIGSTKNVHLLAKSLKQGNFNHAYLFSGPEHVGKFTLAKMFALSAIAGGELTVDVDNFNYDALLDLLVVTPEVVEKNNVSKQRDISIETIRDVKQRLSLFPYHGKYKVLIVDDAHKMNVSAQNGLLKILEEPNETTVIILVTHEIDRILPTILSRCQMIHFGLVDDGDMQKGFSDNFSFSSEAIELSIGRPGLANILNQNPDSLNFRRQALWEFTKIQKSSLNDKFKLAEELSKDIVKTLEKLNIWIWELRKMVNLDEQISQESIYDSIEKIQKSMMILKRSNANAKLILETLFMDLS
jgi:DNA polymerase-3 subunit delta'